MNLILNYFKVCSFEVNHHLFQFLHSGRGRVHHATGDAGDRDGHLQDGRLRHEDAGRRVDAGEEDGQDLPAGVNFINVP